MTWSYHYTPYIWPSLVSAVFLAALGIYSLRRRTAPGAVALSVMTGWGILWVAANGLGLAGNDDATRIFWFQCQAALVLPTATAELCFILEYSGLDKWVTLRTTTLLAIAPIVFALLILTNDWRHLVWTRIWFDGAVRADRGPAHWGAIGYGLLLSLVRLIVLARLFARSPRHRWIAAGLIVSSLGIRGASFFNITDRNPFEPLNPMVLVSSFALIPYALAVMRLRMFEVAPVARNTAVECMSDGLMVLDVEDCVADMNKAAEEVLGVPRSRAIGVGVSKVLEAWPELLQHILNPAETECEASFGNSEPRWYHVAISPIVDRRGFQLGRLVMLRDVTERKRTQAQLLDQQRALAMLKERELLARELHDGIGQAAAAAHMQIACAREFLARGDAASLESCLNSLADATQEVKKSVGDYLLGIKTVSSTEQGFLVGIRRYVDQYSQKYGIRVELTAAPELEERRLDPGVEAQLQPIIQEALTNVRKHSGARSARVAFTPCDSRVRVTIEDDGRGFDPDAAGESQGFGLRSMRGRAEELGASLEVDSAPGKGTIVSIQAPWPTEEKT